MNSTIELQYEVERFLYRESRLLDQGKYHEWLNLLTDDIRYWVPIRETVVGTREGIHSPTEIAVAHMDDDKAMLGIRVQRMDTGLAHAETPFSRTRHVISNVEAAEAEGEGDEVTALSNFLLFQGRRESSDFIFSGHREDRLRRVNGAWHLAKRTVLLDHTVLPRTISIFF